MNRKAQASLEYLLTYGWALVLIATVIAVLIFLLGSTSKTVFSSDSPDKMLLRGGAMEGSTAVAVVQNVTGGGITVTGIEPSSNYSGCSLDGVAFSGRVGVGAGATMTLECSLSEGETNPTGSILISYDDFSSLSRTATIRINSSGQASGGGGEEEAGLSGSGTEEDPFVIYDAAGLQAMNGYLDDPDVYFELGSDIDASETSGWNIVSGCESFSSKASCDAAEGCGWVVLGASCEGESACETHSSYNDCMAEGGSCTGDSGCESISQQWQCGPTSGICTGQGNCSSYFTSFSCNLNGVCSGGPGCSSYVSSFSCSMAGCTWTSCQWQTISCEWNSVCNWFEDDSVGNCFNQKGFLPIGNISSKFLGHFDGKSHTISNLFIDRKSDDFIGLFGYLGSGSEVKDVTLEESFIQGDDYVSLLAGVNKGSISDSYIGGDVNGTNCTGSVAGCNAGTITGSWSGGTQSSGSFVGFLGMSWTENPPQPGGSVSIFCIAPCYGGVPAGCSECP